MSTILLINFRILEFYKELFESLIKLNTRSHHAHIQMHTQAHMLYDRLHFI